MRKLRLYADLVLTNGKIVTIDENESIEEAVAVKFGLIVAVGKNDEIREFIGEGTTVIDLKGRTVIPGLIDSHCHMTSTGGSNMLTVDLSEESGVHSIADIQARIAEKATKTSKGEWILGVGEDDSKLAEKRHPTRWDLDVATRDHPVFVSTVGGHFYMVNSKAIEMAGVNKETPDPEGGKFERDPETRELTGGVHETAMRAFMPEGYSGMEPPRDIAAEGAKQILMACASTGLTCVCDMVAKSQIRAVLDLKNGGELPIRVRMDVIMDLFPEMEKLGIYRGLGDNWARITGLKFFFDGAISARTAAVSEPYLHRPNFYGVMATTREIATKTIMDAYEAGYRISAHANGDRAIDMYLDIMEEAQEKYPREDPRNRDIHCTVVNPEIVARIKKLGMLPTIFGPYPYYHGDKIIPAFGEKRLEWMFAARSFLDAGVKVTAHSDHNAAPFPPLMGIHALVNRKTKASRPIGQSQKISVMEALKLYTINAAYQSFDEDKLGSIEVGKYADMVVLGEDILTAPPETIIDIPIDMTIIEGKIVYEREN
jgi:predicted amidohydrolase YtcJ